MIGENPVQRAIGKAKNLHVTIITPMIGERILTDSISARRNWGDQDHLREADLSYRFFTRSAIFRIPVAENSSFQLLSISDKAS
jgi:hypothetical protein